MKHCRLRTNSKQESGINLVELMLAIGIVSMLALISSDYIKAAKERAHDAIAKQTYANLTTAIETFMSDESVAPVAAESYCETNILGALNVLCNPLTRYFNINDFQPKGLAIIISAYHRNSPMGGLIHNYFTFLDPAPTAGPPIAGSIYTIGVMHCRGSGMAYISDITRGYKQGPVLPGIFSIACP